MHLSHSSILNISKKLRSRELTSLALTEMFLSRIQEHDPTFNAFTTVTEELAIKQAKRADYELSVNRYRGALHGIPIAIKDNIATKGIRTTYGSKIFANNVPTHNATIINLLNAAGAVILGKTGMHELAYGMSGVNPHFGAARNPHNSANIAGGSSSGSAAAVAGEMALAAIGTDTGGSVRQPAHMCGLVGFKPSFGRISKFGVKPLAFSMDHVGTLTNTVEDALVLLNALEGIDPLDKHSKTFNDREEASASSRSISEVRVGILQDDFFVGHEPVADVVWKAVYNLEEAGVKTKRISIPKLDEALRAARLTFAEASVVFDELLAEHPDNLGDDVKKKLERGREITALDYLNAQNFRELFRDLVEEHFEQFDVLVLPTATVAAQSTSVQSEDFAHLSWRNCGIFNFTGHPAISVPCGRTENNLPVGLMLVGSIGRDHKLLYLADEISKILNDSERN